MKYEELIERRNKGRVITLNKINIVKKIMIIERGLQKLVKDYVTLQEKGKKMSEADDKFWKEESRMEKIFQRELKKKIKLPKSVSMKVGNYKISQTIRWGWLKVKKIK